MVDVKKLDKWADLLLDTGKRNNLINFKDTLRTRELRLQKCCSSLLKHYLKKWTEQHLLKFLIRRSSKKMMQKNPLIRSILKLRLGKGLILQMKRLLFLHNIPGEKRSKETCLIK